jgi:cell division ATPase FtsA
VVTDDDERDAVAAAVAGVPLPVGRASLQVLVREFNVDGQGGISRPSGLTIAGPLEASVLIVTGSTAARDELVACVRTAGPRVTDVVAAPLAAGAMLLSPAEQELGVALLDVERDSIGLAVFERGGLRHLRVVGLSGSPCEDTAIELARAAVLESGYAERLHVGVVLTGSQAMMPGLSAQLGQALELPVEVGSPCLAGPNAASIDGRPFAAAFGLLILERPSDAWRHVETPQPMDGRGWTG